VPRTRIDPERVGALVRAVAREEIAPRFRLLGAEQVQRKTTPGDPDDIVTDADLAIERRLTVELRALLPGSVVVGEEAVAADPALLAALHADAPVWILDPIDGTKNFAAGRETFGSMLALAEAGTTRSAWIYLFADDALFVAEAGAGAWRDGRRLGPRAATAPERKPAGTISMRFPPVELLQELAARAERSVTVTATSGSTAIEYTRLAESAQDFAVFYRMLPWDHAPGVLLVTEAGGAARCLDGSAYRPVDASQPLIVVRHASMWKGLRRALFAPAGRLQ
jgi:fructose-1,6-bisphosphatase/inositol monophosphatase family enzyme